MWYVHARFPTSKMFFTQFVKLACVSASFVSHFLFKLFMHFLMKMKVVFFVRYETNFGESLFLSGSLWENWKNLIPMTWSEGGMWCCTVTLEPGDIKIPLEYKYVMVNDGKNRDETNDKNDMCGRLHRTAR